MRNYARRLTRLVVTILCGLALMSNALGQDFSNRADLDGRAAMALQRAAAQFASENQGNVGALRSYDVQFRETTIGIFSVEFTPKMAGASAVDYNVPVDLAIPVTRAVKKPDLSGARQLTGDYVHALKVAYEFWKNTDIGRRFGLLRTAATITQPYPGTAAASLFWVYFTPPQPIRPRLTIGCGVERGFSVNFSSDSVRPLKPVC
jgi:hypothetical protein